MQDTTLTAQARRLRQQLHAQFGVNLSHAQALTFLAQTLGYRSYEALKADRAPAAPVTPPAPEAAPLPANTTVYVGLRIHDQPGQPAEVTVNAVRDALLRAIAQDGPDAFLTRLDFEPDDTDAQDQAQDQDEDLDPLDAQWDFVGGPLIDKVEDDRLPIEEAAAEFEAEYGPTQDWVAYIRHVLHDRSTLQNGLTRAAFLHAYHAGPWTPDPPTRGLVTLRLPFGVENRNEAVMTIPVNSAGGVDLRGAAVALHLGTSGGAESAPTARVDTMPRQVHRMLLRGPDAHDLAAWFTALTQALLKTRSVYRLSPYPAGTPTTPCPNCALPTRDAGRGDVTCEHCTHTWTPAPRP